MTRYPSEIRDGDPRDFRWGVFLQATSEKTLWYRPQQHLPESSHWSYACQSRPERSHLRESQGCSDAPDIPSQEAVPVLPMCGESQFKKQCLCLWMVKRYQSFCLFLCWLSGNPMLHGGKSTTCGRPKLQGLVWSSVLMLSFSYLNMTNRPPVCLGFNRWRFPIYGGTPTNHPFLHRILGIPH